MSAQPNPERHTWTPDEVWAAMMLATNPTTCTSILNRVPIRAGNTRAPLLRRALRRYGLPPADTHIIVTPPMLAAIIEAGPITTSDALAEVDGQLW